MRRLAILTLVAAALVVVALFAARAQARSAYTVVTLSTTQSEFLPGVQNEGWWDDAGTHSVGNDNYEVGNAPDEGAAIFRNFFAFDGSLASGCARNAALQIPIGEGSGDFGGVTTGATYVLHSVETDPLTLVTTGGPDLTIFSDLGSGALYGSKFLPTAAPYRADQFVVPLNGAALRDLNAAIATDSFFTVGGMIDGEPADTSLFGFTPVTGPNGDRPTNLIVTLGPCTGFTG